MDENGETTVQNLHFFYDAQSKPAFVEYNNVMYRYLYNLQGDIVGIIDSSGVLVAEYKYDVNGRNLCAEDYDNILSRLNPFRYRHYIYDEETQLYNLETRAYSYSWGRFISADVMLGNLGGITEHNIYMYCKNNRIACCDASGMTCFILVPDLKKQISMMDSDYIAIDSETISDDISEGCTIVGSSNIDMGSWEYRIDDPNTPNEHIHITDHHNNEKYNQYRYSGNPKHKNDKGNKTGPSRRLKEKIKEKIGWDWDANGDKRSNLKKGNLKKGNLKKFSYNSVYSSSIDAVTFMTILCYYAKQCFSLLFI